MPVMRVNRNKNYTTMSNVHLRDLNLSLKARGLLSTILSLPDNWNYSIGGLASICKESETCIKSVLKELKETGYMVVEKLYSDESGTGKFKYVYNIFENPEDSKELREQLNKKESERTSRGVNPPVEVPEVEAIPLYKYTDIQNTEQLNTENINAFNSNELKGNNIHASCNDVTLQKVRPINPHNYTEEELRNHLTPRISRILQNHGELTTDTLDNLLEITVYFCAKFKEIIGVNHPVLSERALNNIVARYLYPPEFLETYDVFSFEDYKVMIDKYFLVEYGKYSNGKTIRQNDITLSLSHFMSDTIREHLFRQATGL